MSNKSAEGGEASVGVGTSQAETKSWEEKAANPGDPEAGEEMSTGAKFANILSSDPNMKMEAKIADSVTSDDGKA